jgi:uncharacterized SAM-binding protein YcdF (DUF218 family)
MDSELIKNSKLLWDYHLIKNDPHKSQFILLACSSQLETAQTVISLYKQKYAPKIILSGGYGSRSRKTFIKPEADIYQDILLKHGIPKADIFIENNSTNLLENIQNTKKYLTKYKTGIAVSNPWVSRRFAAHLKMKLPNIIFTHSYPKLSFNYYYQKLQEDLINLLVKDLNTIIRYGGKDLEKQPLPAKITQALSMLTNLGYPKNNEQP